MRNRPVFLCLVAAVLAMMAIPCRGIDPDIQRALKEAPPPGDYGDALSLGVFPDRMNAVASMERHSVLRKLAHLHVASIDFKDVPAVTAFLWLVDQSVVSDANHEGIWLAFDLRVMTGWDNFKPLDQKVTLSLQDPHLDEALKRITEALKLRYEVEGTVVYIRPAN